MRDGGRQCLMFGKATKELEQPDIDETGKCLKNNHRNMRKREMTRNRGPGGNWLGTPKSSIFLNRVQTRKGKIGRKETRGEGPRNGDGGE